MSALGFPGALSKPVIFLAPPPLYPAWVNPSVGTAKLDTATVLSANSRNNAVFLLDTEGSGLATTTSMFKAIYKAAGAVKPAAIQDTGVTYEQASPNGWLLQNSVGGELTWGASNYLPDLANTGYQQAWAQNVYNTLSSLGINAVFNDGPVYDYHDATSADAYRSGSIVTAAAYRTDTIAFWRYAAEYLRSRGIHIAANSAASSDDDAAKTKAWWPQLVFNGSFMNGKGVFDWFFAEYWLRVSFGGLHSVRLDNNSQWYYHWADHRTLVDTAHSIGSGFIGFDWGSDTSGRDIADAAYDVDACTFERASLLLAFDPALYDCHILSTKTDDQWTIDSHSVNIGLPTAAAVQQANGTWTRSFSNGQVIVNPTTSTQTTFGQTLTTGTAYIGA